MSDPSDQGDGAAAFRPPLSTSAAALLENGSDGRFRAMVYDLLALEAQMREARDRLAVEMGVSGPGYMIVMVIAQKQAEGIGINSIARQLHVSGAFVTTEVGKLVRAGLVDKRRNPEDRRGVLLRLTAAGEARVKAIAPDIRAVNDYFFGDLRAAEFDSLSRLAARLGSKSAAECFAAEEDAA
jgi:DNA-binding MarR family transcriptional regulator